MSVRSARRKRRRPVGKATNGPTRELNAMIEFRQGLGCA